LTTTTIKPTNVLVVDDEQKMCFSLKTMLENRGLNVEVATSGKTAMETIPTLRMLDQNNGGLIRETPK